MQLDFRRIRRGTSITIIINAGPKAEIQGLLDAEGLPGIGLLIRPKPGDPDTFDFGASLLGDNTDVSPSGLAVFIDPDADKAGTYRLDISAGVISLTAE